MSWGSSIKVKNRILDVSLIIMLLFLILLTFWMVYSSGIQQSKIFTTTVTSTGTISPRPPFLVLQISPPGYPPIGETWRINVFIVKNFGEPILEPALNVTVTISLLDSGKSVTYKLPISENGEAIFTYRQEFTDIAFQASGSNITNSNIIVLTSRFVQAQDIENPLYFSGLTLVAEIATFFVHIRKAGKLGSKSLRIIENSVIALDIVLLLLVTVLSVYVRLFLGTIWGYPEKIVGSFITVSLMKNVFYLGFMMFLGIMIYKIFISLKRSKS